MKKFSIWYEMNNLFLADCISTCRKMNCNCIEFRVKKQCNYMLKALTLQDKSYAFIDNINNTYKKGGH